MFFEFTHLCERRQTDTPDGHNKAVPQPPLPKVESGDNKRGKNESFQSNPLDKSIRDKD